MKLAIIILILGFCYCGSYATANRIVCTQYPDNINFRPSRLHEQGLIENPEVFVSKKEDECNPEGVSVGSRSDGQLNRLNENPEMYEKKRLGECNPPTVRYGRRSNGEFNRLIENPEICVSKKRGECNVQGPRLKRISNYELNRLFGNLGKLEKEESALTKRIGDLNKIDARLGRSSPNDLDRDFVHAWRGAGEPEYYSKDYEWNNHDYEF